MSGKSKPRSSKAAPTGGRAAKAIGPASICHILLNSQSGTARELGLTGAVLGKRLEAAFAEVTVDDDAHRPLAERVSDATRSAADLVIAAGGDGTVTALAQALAGGNKVLGVLPLGTANLLARDLSIPLELEEWVARLEDMEERRIDVGEVNGRIFLHKVVIGFVPGIAAGRELLRGRDGIGARLAFLRYFLRRLFRSRRLAVEVRPVDGEPRIHRVQALAVASNAYEEGFARFFSRPRLDQGILTLYILKHLGLRDLGRLLVAMLLGRWRSDEALQIESVEAVTIRSTKKVLKVMMDGEVNTLRAPMHFIIRPQALKVLAPPVAAARTPSLGARVEFSPKE